MLLVIFHRKQICCVPSYVYFLTWIKCIDQLVHWLVERLCDWFGTRIQCRRQWNWLAMLV